MPIPHIALLLSNADLLTLNIDRDSDLFAFLIK